MNKKVKILIASAALSCGVSNFIVPQRVEAKEISTMARESRLESKKSNHEVNNNKSTEKVNEARENAKSKLKAKFEEANKELKKLGDKALGKSFAEINAIYEVGNIEINKAQDTNKVNEALNSATELMDKTLNEALNSAGELERILNELKPNETEKPKHEQNQMNSTLKEKVKNMFPKLEKIASANYGRYYIHGPISVLKGIVDKNFVGYSDENIKTIIDDIQYYFGYSVGAEVGEDGVDGFIAAIDKLYAEFENKSKHEQNQMNSTLKEKVKNMFPKLEKIASANYGKYYIHGPISILKGIVDKNFAGYSDENIKTIIDDIQYYFGHSVGAEVGEDGVDGFIAAIDKLYAEFENR